MYVLLFNFAFFDKSLFTEDYLIVYPEMYCETPVI